MTLPENYVPSIKQEDVTKYLMAADTFTWCHMNRIKLVGGEYKLEGHEYQADWLRSKARKRCYRKATQMAVTETEVLRALHDMIYRELPKGALFLFPTADEVSDFSSTRFNPLLKENQPIIGKYVRETDRTNLKRIGSGFLYFRGARMQEEDEGMGTKKKSAKLKCHDDQTEILTKNKWKKFSDLTLNDEVATRSPSGIFMWQKITHIHKYQFEGNMLHFKTPRGLDFCVTNNHRLLLTEVHYKEKEWFDLAGNLKNGSRRRGFSIVRTTNNWSGTIPNFIYKKENKRTGEYNFIKIFGNRINSRWEARKPDRFINLKNWVAFLGLYISEGCTEGIMSGELKPGQGRVCISQETKSKHFKKIKNLLSRLPFNWVYNGHTFRASDKELANLMFPMGNKYNKTLPDWVLDLPTRYLMTLWKYAVMGDGHVSKNGFVSYATTSKKLADQLQEILHKCGGCASIKTHLPNGKSPIKGRLVNSISPIHIVFSRSSKTSEVPIPVEQNYKGDVFCVSVPNGTTLTRRNGYTLWSGNSIPVDRLVLDEYDEMPEEARTLGIGRMQASEKKEEVYIANPTLPGYGIDKIYEDESDQRVWLLKCQKCGKRTCLELEFPNCLERTAGQYAGAGLVVDTLTAGRVMRVCIHCRSELGLRHGIWEPRVPGREMEGYWISHLSSSTVSATEILNEWEKHDLNIIQFYNLRLGMGYAKIDDQLSKADVLNCCRRDAMASRHDGPCAMGVDVGKILNVVIGCRPRDGQLRVVKAARVSSFNDVNDLAKAFNVKCAVFDIEPETRKVREFQKAVNFEVFLCKYKESQAKDMTFDTDAGLCLVNRTEILDATHYLVTVPGRLELPRRDAEVEVFADQLSSVAKRLEKNEKTGKSMYIYKALRPDHYRHAMNYLYMAASRVGIFKPTEWVKKKSNKGWEQDFDDSAESGATGWMGL